MPDVTIKYDNRTISEMSTNTTATLKCNNKRMKTDLEVKYEPKAKLIPVVASYAVTDGPVSLTFTSGDPCTVQQDTGLLVSLLSSGMIGPTGIPTWTYFIPEIIDNKAAIAFSASRPANTLKIKVNNELVPYDSDTHTYSYQASWAYDEIPSQLVVSVSTRMAPTPTTQSFEYYINDNFILTVDAPANSLPAHSTMLAPEVDHDLIQNAWDNFGDERGYVIVGCDLSFQDQDGDEVHPARAVSGTLRGAYIADTPEFMLARFLCDAAGLSGDNIEIDMIEDCYVSGSTVTFEMPDSDVYAIVGFSDPNAPVNPEEE